MCVSMHGGVRLDMLFTLLIFNSVWRTAEWGRGDGGGSALWKGNYKQIFHSFWRTLGSDGDVWSQQTEKAIKQRCLGSFIWKTTECKCLKKSANKFTSRRDTEQNPSKASILQPILCEDSRTLNVIKIHRCTTTAITHIWFSQKDLWQNYTNALHCFSGYKTNVGKVYPSKVNYYLRVNMKTLRKTSNKQKDWGYDLKMKEPTIN